MDVREKLVELLCKSGSMKCDSPTGECTNCLKLADYLITNGVTVLPCNIGQKIWLVFTPKHPANPSDKGKWFVVQDGVQRIIYGVKGVSIETWNMGTIPGKEIGKKLFFTREEAAAALTQPPKGE